MKKWQIILLVIVVGVIGIGSAKNILIKNAITVAVPQVLGTPVRIDNLQVGIFRPVVHMQGIKIYNPPGFPSEPFVDIQEVKVQYDLGAVLRKDLHLPLVILKMKEVVMVKNKEGKLNLDSLKIAEQKEAPAKKEKPADGKKPAQELAMRIDRLELDLGKVVVKDLKDDPPSVLAYDVGVHNKVYKDIKSAQQLSALVLLEAMGPTGIRAAGIYGAATILGVAFLPAGVAGILIANDSGIQEYAVDFEKAYQSSLAVLAKMGKIVLENRNAGTIKAKVEGSDVVLAIEKKSPQKVSIKVSARKYMIPKPEVAQGILYQITEIIK